MDITEVILADHHEQRRMFAMLDDLDRSDIKTLTVLWDRLSAMLEVHAQAEELYFYPELLALGRRLRDGSEAEETKDAIGDHNDIRDGILEAARHEVGSDGWWSGVDAARHANDEHMGEEEHEACGTSASMSTWRQGTGSPCRSSPTRPNSSPACPSRTRTPSGTSRTRAAAAGLGRLSK
jgi:hypothetical protein